MVGLFLVLWACRDKDAPDSAPVDDSAPADDSASEDDSAPAYDDAGFEALIAAIEADQAALGAPGVAVAVFDRDGVVWAKGFGDRHPRDPEQGPVGPRTLFRAGSIGKSMTTVALLQLVDEGGVALDDAVVEHVPELDFALDPSWAPSVEVQHLLTHSAGFYDWFTLDSGADELLAAGLDTFDDSFWLMAPAGRFYNYSNPHFSLAGRAVERLRGAWYREVLRDRVFAPLGMGRSTFSDAEALADGDFAYGLTAWGGGSFPQAVGPSDYDSAFVRPAGMEWTSAEELAQFGRFLMVGDPGVLSDALREEMQSPQVDMGMGGGFYSYGYGLLINPGFYAADSYIPATVVSHDGAIMGYAAQLAFLPEQGWGVVLLASTDGAYLYNALTEALLLAPGLPAPTALPDLDPDPSLYADAAGAWLDPYNTGRLVVSGDAEGLTVSLPDLDAVGYPYEAELIPYTPDNYILGIGGSYSLLTLIRDEDGQPEYLRARFAVWTVDAATAVARPGVSPDPARLDALLGRPDEMLHCSIMDLLRCNMGPGGPFLER